MYTRKNFPSKKALKDAIASGERACAGEIPSKDIPEIAPRVRVEE